MVARSMPPKAMAKRLVRLLRPQRPDYPYLKKVFQHTRELLQIKPRKAQKRLPELLTDEELVAFYETVWHGRHPTHMVLIKLLLFTGVRNAELAHVQLKDVDLNPCQLRIEQGKGKKDRYVLFPKSFRGELTHYLESQKKKGATYLFESNRLQPYSTRRIRQIIKQYALEAGITKRVYPHLFRHQIITYLTKQGIISPKLQLLSGHAEEKSLAIYRDLALADVAGEYEEAMRAFPIMMMSALLPLIAARRRVPTHAAAALNFRGWRRNNRRYGARGWSSLPLPFDSGTRARTKIPRHKW